VSSVINVDHSTINNWEAGRRAVPLERLMQLADILEFSMDYLSGRDGTLVSQTEPINKALLPTLHRQPVWTNVYGWCFVNSVEESLVLFDGSSVPFDVVSEALYSVPPALSFSLCGVGNPLNLKDVLKREKIWLEPITGDLVLKNEARGWYHLHDDKRLVQNEYGARFYLDTYGVKWLAFNDCLDGFSGET